METQEKSRNVLVYKDNGDSKLKFQTTAKEFSEILDVIKKKFGMNDSEISKYEFIDGIHRTRYASNSVLPEKSIHPRTGQETTDLSIFMVRTKKNTESGSTPKKMVIVDRKAVVARINEKKYNTDILETFGKNLTQVSTDDLFVYVYIKENKQPALDFVVKSQTILDNKAETAISSWHCFNPEVPAARSVYKKNEDVKQPVKADGRKEEKPELQNNEEVRTEGQAEDNGNEGTVSDSSTNESGKTSSSPAEFNLSNVSTDELEEEIIRRYKDKGADDANGFVDRFNTAIFGNDITDADMKTLARYI